MAALVDLDRMKARLAELDAEREPLLALIKAAEAYEGATGKSLFPDGVGVVRARHRPETGAGRAAPVMIATEAAVSEVLEAMGPLSTGDILKFVATRPELNLPTKNPINVLSARLSNSGKFVSQRGVGWWFKRREWPSRFVPLCRAHNSDGPDDDLDGPRDREGDDPADTLLG